MSIETYCAVQDLVAKKGYVSRGRLVLDSGTGPCAFLAIRLAEFVGLSGLVIAVDYEREYGSSIKDAIDKSGFSKRISFLLADLRCIPIRDGALDASVSLDTIQNMYGNDVDVERVVKAYIEESARTVRSGGKVVVGTRHPVPRNKAQEVYIELRLFDSKLEYLLWGEQSRFYFEHELVSWLKKAGLKDVKAEIIEHNLPYKRDIEKRTAKISKLLQQLKPPTESVRLNEEHQKLIHIVETHGEEWLPTLIVTGTM